jgi:GDP-L-fucose synthase
MKKILLIGGSGFIGKNIYEQLKDKYEIFSPSHKELDLYDEDKVSEYIRKNDFEVIIHCATKPGHRNAIDLNDLVKINTRMFFNIVRNNAFFGRMLYLGSGSVYDKRYYKPKLKEEDFDKHIPIDDTGYTKYICSKYIESSKNVIDLRIFGIFGKYEDYAIRFISNAICRSIFNKSILIKENKKFDYIYIDDFIKILEFFIDNKTKYNAYNVTPDESIEIKKLAELINVITKNKNNIIIEKEELGFEYSGDNSRLRSEIKPIEFTPFEIVIEKLYKWYYENKAFIDEKKVFCDEKTRGVYK